MSVLGVVGVPVAKAHGLAQPHVTMWWVSIGMGFVVVLVVIVLLSLLLAFVNDIDRDVSSILATAGGIAGNTAKIPALGDTAALTGALGEELGRHAATLGSLRGL
jgi:predicted permease